MEVTKVLSFLLMTCVCVSFGIVVENNFKIGLKTLILSNDANLDLLPRQKIKSYGAAFDLLRVIDENGAKVTNIVLDLYDSKNNPKYNSLVFIDSTLSVKNPSTGLYFSALTKQQWDDIGNYKDRFGVRSVYLSSNANVDPALIQLNSTNNYADVRFTRDDVVKQFNSNVRSDATFKLGNEYEVQSKEIVFYQTPIKIDAKKNKDNHIMPFMEIKAQSADDDDSSYNVGAFIRKVPGNYFGEEEMHFLFTSNAGSHHGLVLADIWYTWVTKGIFLGQRRILLNTHIDDYLLATELYGHPQDSYRNSATDLELLVNYQTNRRANMPPTSNYTIELAFNGIGYDNEKGTINDGSTEELNNATYRLRDHFLWVSHTWSHMDLYCVNSNCTTPVFSPSLDCYNWTESVCNYTERDDGLIEPEYPVSGYSPYEYIVYEVTRNQHWAKDVLFKEFTREEMDQRPNWSPHSIVTPRISGLNYTVAIRAMLEAGLFSAVGDNSRRDLAPEDPFHGFNAKPLTTTGGADFSGTPEIINGKDGLFVIPRFATRIYYDCSAPEESAAEYNTFYGPKCYGYDQDRPISFEGLKCNSTSPKNDFNFTFEQMMQVESYETSRNLLGYLTEPYMFHQANLRFYDGKQSLLSYWVDSALEYVLKYNTFPILSHKMDDLEKFYRERMAVDACEVSGYLEYKDGLPINIHLESTQAETCEGRISITKTQGNDELMKFGKDENKAQAAYHKVERYGVDSTYSYFLSKSAPVAESVVVAELPSTTTTTQIHSTTSTSSGTSSQAPTSTESSTEVANPQANPSSPGGSEVNTITITSVIMCLTTHIIFY